MSTLDGTRAELALLVLYLSRAESRDKICRAIQYGSKFLSDGQPGTAQNVDKSTSLARKVFRLLNFVNGLHSLVSPTSQETPLSPTLLGKNKERTELIGRISIYCWLGSSVCATLVELRELGRLSASVKKLEEELKNNNKYENEQFRAKLMDLFHP